MDAAPVTCPSCFEVFDVVVPPHGELPTEFDLIVKSVAGRW